MQITNVNQSYAPSTAAVTDSSSVSPSESKESLFDVSSVETVVFRESDFGNLQKVAALLRRVDCSVNSPLNELRNNLGESDRDIADQVEGYIERGESPPPAVFGNSLAGASTTETRVDRMKKVLDVAEELLESAKEPGRNALHVLGRTGLVIALAAVARQFVVYLVERALRESDASEASRAWAGVAAAMMGPALVGAGALLRHFEGESSLASKLGAAFLTVGATGLAIGACVTGAASNLFPTVAGGLVYNLVRALADLLVPLKDNAGPANAAATGVTAVFFGAFQFAQTEVASLMPLNGLARAAQGLGYSFRDDLFPIVSTTVAQMIDAGVLIASKNSEWLSPRQGPDSASFDEESLRNRALKTETVLQWPTKTQMANTFLNVAGARISFGVALAASGGLLADYLSKSELGDDTQGHTLNSCLAMLAVFLYVALIYSIAKRTDNTYDLKVMTSA
ncbi:hypothetical protein SAMN03159382_00798 [Pseudomonas sp. NFACC23-1]|uniref:hypothetical protein n=1 Tax=unclassified Pseudomonas TaxID=196821 RepID=UPI00088D9256|nr:MULTISPECIES: hypothetical protein [unclassified Pseudomonas]SDB05513.1 hypothetical protein SAMN03159386_00310 [Pseudomonas sp. NFACC17-2]SEI99429.1 hypothetical protein SAMN03159382_00798 [Pseudomonas sp. NFACC23-1]SFW35910.1 hypothetical protein SAMN05660640_01080 [Pseudomonas sp. NFACC16-2]